MCEDNISGGGLQFTKLPSLASAGGLAFGVLGYPSERLPCARDILSQGKELSVLQSCSLNKVVKVGVEKLTLQHLSTFD